MKNIGICPICHRDMIDDGKSINQHHFVPKSRGGKEQEFCHRICHDMLHRTWTNKELENNYSDPELIRNDEKMQNFLRWIKNKPETFYESSKDSRDRKGKSRR